MAELGELDDTVVIVTSDNGCPFPRVKGQIYDDDFRLPFAVMWLDRITLGRVVDDLVSFIDIFPTFLDCAGLRFPHTWSAEACSTCSTARGRASSPAIGIECTWAVKGTTWGERMIWDIRFVAPGRIATSMCKTLLQIVGRRAIPKRTTPTATVAQRRAVFVELHEKGVDKYYDFAFAKRPIEELYDIASDLYCIDNLAYDRDLDELKESLWADLESKLVETGDPRILSRGDWFERVEYVGDAQLSWGSTTRKETSEILASIMMLRYIDPLVL